MASGQNVRSGSASISIAPVLLAAVVATALLVGSLIGLGAASSRPHDPTAAERPAAAVTSDALVDIRASERASETADELARSSAQTAAALGRVRADERASEIPLAAVLAQIRAEEHALIVR